MLDIIKGRELNFLLFVPRLDVWYNANKSRGTLPEKFADLTLVEITRKMGVGFHSVIPDFLRSGREEDIYHRAIGFYNHPDFPYRADFSSIDYQVKIEESELIVRYNAGHGSIVTKIKYNREVFDSGVSIPAITEYPIKEPKDYITLAEIFSKVKIIPTPENYEKYHSRIGEDGIAVAYLSCACSPIQHIMRDLRKMDQFFLDLYDIPKNISVLQEALEPLYDAIIESVLFTNAEAAFFGGNYDDVITYPPFFDKYLMPWLKKASERLHASGKYLLTHTDGENQNLMSLYLQCNFDIADSVCPAPMTNMSLKEYRDYFSDRITIWGGIPSIITLKSSFKEDDFRNYILSVIKECYPYNNLILNIADTTPPDADFERIEYICEQVKEVSGKH